MNAIVEQLLESPDLPDIVDQLQARLAEERVRQQKFYEETPEGIKAEYVIRDGAYHLALKSGSGEVGSVAVSGFCIPIRAIFDAQVSLQTRRELLASSQR